MLKYSALTSISIYLLWSLFMSVYGLVDVMGDVHGLNYTTRIHLEDMVVAENNTLVYQSIVARELDPAIVPIPGTTQINKNKNTAFLRIITYFICTQATPCTGP